MASSLQEELKGQRTEIEQDYERQWPGFGTPPK